MYTKFDEDLICCLNIMVSSVLQVYTAFGPIVIVVIFQPTLPNLIWISYRTSAPLMYDVITPIQIYCYYYDN